MMESIATYLPGVIIFAVFSWLVWWMLLRDRSTTSEKPFRWWHLFWFPFFFDEIEKRERRRNPNVGTKRDRVLFVIFILLCILGFFSPVILRKLT